MTEPGLIFSLISAAVGAGATVVVQMIRTAGESDGKRADTRAKLEEHWADTTLELVGALRTELADARRELGELRPLITRLAHFEEALDHIHNLLAALRSGNPIEVAAAERRAQAFLGRMRSDATHSAQRIAGQ